MRAEVIVPQEKLAEFCRRYPIARLSIFGSALRPDFRPDSDIDVLVELDPDHKIGLGIVRMEEELSDMFGRRVDLRTPGDLSRHFRDRVLREAETVYVRP